MDEPQEAPPEEALSMDNIDLDKLDAQQLKNIIYSQHDAIERLANERQSEKQAEFIELSIEGIGMFKINSPAANDSMELVDKVVSIIKELNLNKKTPINNGTMI